MHYHINWSTSGFDWERFECYEAATKEASSMVRPDETFTIEQVDNDCIVCEKLKSR